jgi:hypothetical protein
MGINDHLRSPDGGSQSFEVVILVHLDAYYLRLHLHVVQSHVRCSGVLHGIAQVVSRWLRLLDRRQVERLQHNP